MYFIILFYIVLEDKLKPKDGCNFYLHKILRAHILPLTNCAFNKSGDKYLYN